MTARWFGRTWHAPCNEPELKTDTPVGLLCLQCAKPIHDGDQGMDLGHVAMKDGLGERAVYHLGCFLDHVLPPMDDTFDGNPFIECTCGFNLGGDVCIKHRALKR